MNKYVLPLGAGVVVFGVATAFAASLSVNSSSLGSGNTTVSSCQSNADVTYTTSGSKVATAVVTFSGGTSGDCDGMDAKVTLTGTGTGLPGSATATVASDAATVDLSSANIDAHDVTGVSVTITG